MPSPTARKSTGEFRSSARVPFRAACRSEIDTRKSATSLGDKHPSTLNALKDAGARLQRPRHLGDHRVEGRLQILSARHGVSEGAQVVN